MGCFLEFNNKFKQSPLLRQADFNPEIWFARLPNWTPLKLKGWYFFSRHSIEDPFKIQVLTTKKFWRNTAFEATSNCTWDFVCQGARVTQFAPPWLDELFDIIQSAWSNSVTEDELPECHQKVVRTQVSVKWFSRSIYTSNKQFRKFHGGAFQWTSIENSMVRNILS